MSYDRKAIVAKIIEILNADTSLDDVEHWYYNEPPKFTFTVFGWVRWRGGPNPAVTAEKQKYEHEYEIVIVCHHTDQDEASKKSMDLIKAAEDVLKNDRTLGGLVADSHTVRSDSDYFIAGAYTNVGARVVLYTRKNV